MSNIDIHSSRGSVESRHAHDAPAVVSNATGIAMDRAGAAPSRADPFADKAGVAPGPRETCSIFFLMDNDEWRVTRALRLLRRFAHPAPVDQVSHTAGARRAEGRG